MNNYCLYPYILDKFDLEIEARHNYVLITLTRTQGVYGKTLHLTKTITSYTEQKKKRKLKQVKTSRKKLISELYIYQ